MLQHQSGKDRDYGLCPPTWSWSSVNTHTMFGFFADVASAPDMIAIAEQQTKSTPPHAMIDCCTWSLQEVRSFARGGKFCSVLRYLDSSTTMMNSLFAASNNKLAKTLWKSHKLSSGCTVLNRIMFNSNSERLIVVIVNVVGRCD